MILKLPKLKKNGCKKHNSMRMHIFGWFILFVDATFLLLWVFQVLFLQNFYNRMKASDIVRIADTMTAAYRTGEYQETFDRLALDNEMCISVLDKYARPVYWKDVMGVNCIIHGRNDSVSEIITQLNAKEEGVLYGSAQNPLTQVNILVYARELRDTNTGERQGYLILNTPLAPVSATVSILRRQLIIITIALLVLGFVFSMVISKRLSAPIAQVTKEAEQLAHGRYDIQFTAGSYDEVNRLAETLTYASREINRVDTMQRDLVANASHDLRTPLTMLKGYAEMIRDLSGNDPVKREQHLEIIIQETDRLTLLVNDILDLSKLENGKMALKPSTFDMEQHLHSIIDRYRGLSAVSGYHFFLETDGEAMVTCDAGKIEQVICNLLNNALNYTGENKEIYLKQEHTPDGLKISVRDTGAGMDQETISRIFDKYYRSENYKREVVGTGLGLSIVKAILRLHNYAFGVDSTVGYGSTFWFIIHSDQT